MNYLRMQAFTRILLGETDSANSYFGDTEIKDMLNDAQIEVATDTDPLLTFRTFTTADGDTRFPLPSDFMKMRSVEIDISTTRRHQLIWTSFDEFNSFISGNFILKGQPAYWKVELGAVDVTTNSPGDVWIYPGADDNGGDNYTLRIYYHQLPQAMSADAEISELPEMLHKAICYYAAIVLSRKDNARGRMQELQVLYDDRIKKFRKIKNQRESRAFVAKNVYKLPGRVMPQGWRNW